VPVDAILSFHLPELLFYVGVEFGLARAFVIIENLELKALYVAVYAVKIFE